MESTPTPSPNRSPSPLPRESGLTPWPKQHLGERRPVPVPVAPGTNTGVARPERCPSATGTGHPLVWLTVELAVCADNAHPNCVWRSVFDRNRLQWRLAPTFNEVAYALAAELLRERSGG